MKTARILIVEDEALIGLDLIMKVREMGHSGFHVSSGKEAIRMVSRNFKPDLILMDVIIGNENGIYIARVIQKFRVVPVLFVTAESRPSILPEIQDLFHAGLIQKPFGKQELGASIRELLDAA